MKRKRIIGMVSLLLSVMLLVACSTVTTTVPTSSTTANTTAGTTANSTADTTSTTSAATTADAGTSTTTEDPLYNPVGSFPIVKEPITLRVFQALSGQSDFETNWYTLHLEELTGLDLTFDQCAAGESAEKLNLLLTSKDYPDVIFFSNIDSNRYGTEEGILIDLAPYIDLMPNLQTEIAEFPFMIPETTAMDGKLYSFPYYTIAYHSQYPAKMWVNTMHLEAMDAAVPTTTDEFLALCRKYKEYDPKGIPFCAFDDWAADPFTFLAGSFTYVIGGSANPYFVVKDGKIVTNVADDSYREAVKYVANLFDEGLLNEDYFTLPTDDVITMLNTPSEPILFAPCGSTFFCDAPDQPDTYDHYVTIAPLKGPDGTQNSMYNQFYSVPKYSVTSACQYPEAAVRFADVFYDQDEAITSQYGEKGVYWNDPDPGAVGLTGGEARFLVYEETTTEIQNKDWLFRGMYHMGEIFLYEQKKADEDFGDVEFIQSWLNYETKRNYEAYKPKGVEPLPKLKFTSDESSSTSTISVEINKAIEEYKAQFITGVLDINNDADWQTYVDALTNAGMPMLIEVIQAAYDRYGN